MFIDETWAKTNMTRLRGRALCGQRLIDKTPHGHWKTTTLIAVDVKTSASNPNGTMFLNKVENDRAITRPARKSAAAAA